MIADYSSPISSSRLRASIMPRTSDINTPIRQERLRLFKKFHAPESPAISGARLPSINGSRSLPKPLDGVTLEFYAMAGIRLASASGRKLSPPDRIG